MNINNQNKKIKNPYTPNACGIGYMGSFNGKTRANGKKIKEYICWYAMLKRCYDERYRYKYPTYAKCSVCEAWHNFSNFYEWIIQEPNYEKWKIEKGFQLDKDIICKGNKEYSPEKCCLVPMRVNYLWTNCNKSRGKYPIGVHKRELCKNRPYVASVTIDGKTKSIGQYATPEEAFQRHKEVQEANIKRIAKEEYAAENISKKCYEAMIKYNIEITD